MDCLVRGFEEQMRHQGPILEKIDVLGDIQLVKFWEPGYCNSKSWRDKKEQQICEIATVEPSGVDEWQPLGHILLKPYLILIFSWGIQKWFPIASFKYIFTRHPACQLEMQTSLPHIPGYSEHKKAAIYHKNMLSNVQTIPPIHYKDWYFILLTLPPHQKGKNWPWWDLNSECKEPEQTWQSILSEVLTSCCLDCSTLEIKYQLQFSVCKSTILNMGAGVASVLYWSFVESAVHWN